MSREVAPGRVHRIVVIGALIALVVVAVAFGQPADRRTPKPIPEQTDIAQIGAATFAKPSRTARDRSVPVASRPDAASVTWFCGGATAARTKLILTNTAPKPRRAMVTAVTSKGRPRTKTVTIAAETAMAVDASFAGSGTLAATVESRHGGLVATQRITGDDTVTTAACATSSSQSWFFAGGDTQRGAKERLVLFNPFDDLATADVTFLTPDGFRHPQATQGLAVPGRSVVVVDVNKVQNRRSGLGSTVTTRAGRLVSWRYESFDGSGPDLAGGQPPKGISVALGLSTPLAHFALPTAVVGSGVSPRIILANPGATDSKVRLDFAVDDPATNGGPPPATFDLVSGAVKVLQGDALRQVAPGVPFSLTGRVLSGGAVVAELWLDGAEPAKGRGSSATMASPVGAKDWAASVGLQAPPLDQLGIRSVSKPATVQLWVIRDGHRRKLTGKGLPVAVPASGRVSVDLAKLLTDHPGDTIIARSTTPVVVSRLQAGRDADGLVSVTALPFAGTFVDP